MEEDIDEDMVSDEESVEEDDNVEMEHDDRSSLAREIPRTKSEKRLWKQYVFFW